MAAYESSRERKKSGDVRIAVIGGGIAGLAAAQKLHEYKFDNTLVLEAMDRLGGRIHTISAGNGFVELGASWLHGEEGNVLYDLAKECHLVDLSENQSVEGDGKFYTNEGELLDYEMVKEVLGFLDGVKEHFRSYQTPEDGSSIMSAGEVFKEKFQEYLSSCKRDVSEAVLWALFEWYMKFEDVDNSCRDLNDVSIKAYSEWYECEGLPLIDFKSGFASVINLILKYLPKDVVRLNAPVKQIKYERDKAEVLLESNELIVADHVIVTCSIGFLRENLDAFFKPPLDVVKEGTIRNIGFDTINKIYLEFESPFWQPDELGFQLVWTSSCDGFPSWVKGVSGFDVVKNHPKMLLCWIGGGEAEEVETVVDEEVKQVCTELLRKFLNNPQIPYPASILRSKWKSNKYTRGAYSYRSLKYEKMSQSIHDLIEPISHEVEVDGVKRFKPVVLFAGEATDPNYYSTTHGALQSGLREAQRILDYYCCDRDLEAML